MENDIELHEHVKLADGKAFCCDYLATIPQGYMFISIKDAKMSEICDAFENEENTRTIQYGEHVLSNYVLLNVKKEGVGRYKVALRKLFADEVR